MISPHFQPLKSSKFIQCKVGVVKMRKVCIFMILLNSLQSCQNFRRILTPFAKTTGLATNNETSETTIWNLFSRFLIFPSFPKTVNLFLYLSNLSNEKHLPYLSRKTKLNCSIQTFIQSFMSSSIDSHILLPVCLKKTDYTL